MSAPLILLFIYTYPSSVPTWLNIDKNYEILQADNISKQIAAITYFKNRDS